MATKQEIIRSFKSIREGDYGARFYKTDMHFHTPASEDARGSNKYDFNPFKTKYPKKKDDPKEYQKKIKEIQEKILEGARGKAVKIVDRFIKEKLSLVAVTDHNSLGTIWPDEGADKVLMHLAAPTWYELIDDEVEKRNQAEGRKVLTILPGVEISTVGLHILAIFPRQNPRRKIHFIICDLLHEVGFAIDDFGKNPKVGKVSINSTIDLICKKGGIPIPAHIDGSDQALLDLYKLTGGAMKNVLKSKKLSALEIVTVSKFIETDKKLKKPVKTWLDELRIKEKLTPFAFFQGSDAHDFKTIGKRISYIKMTEPSFSGLKLSINSPATRVRIKDARQAIEKGLFIYGMEARNDFLGKQFIRFNRHLNCVTGRKNSGKTCLFRLMEKAVDPHPESIEGEVLLFIEKVVDSKPCYYALCSEENSGFTQLFSVDRDSGQAELLDSGQSKDLMQNHQFFD